MTKKRRKRESINSREIDRQEERDREREKRRGDVGEKKREEEEQPKVMEESDFSLAFPLFLSLSHLALTPSLCRFALLRAWSFEA